MDLPIYFSRANRNTPVLCSDMREDCYKLFFNEIFIYFLFFAFSKRKLCNGINFRIKDFYEFQCFRDS